MRPRGLAWHAAVGLLLMVVMARPLMALDFSDIAREGELRFLTVNPDPEAYRYEARVSLTRQSLETGLVESATCHRRLDPIRKVVIAFNPDRLQTFSVAEFSGIGGCSDRGPPDHTDRGGARCLNLHHGLLSCPRPQRVWGLEAPCRSADAALPGWLPSHGGSSDCLLATGDVGRLVRCAGLPAGFHGGGPPRWRSDRHGLCWSIHGPS